MHLHLHRNLLSKSRIARVSLRSRVVVIESVLQVLVYCSLDQLCTELGGGGTLVIAEHDLFDVGQSARGLGSPDALFDCEVRVFL